jgi:hypothetical protein
MEEDLFLAIPGHLVFLFPGFTAPPRLEILEAVGDDRWFAVPSRLGEDPSAVSVSALILRYARGEDGIMRRAVDTAGRFAVARPFTAAVTSLAPGLGGLRVAVRRWCEQESGTDAPHGVRGVELLGHCFDTAQGRVLFLVYDVEMDPAAAMSGTWVPAVQAAALATNTLDQRLAPVLGRRS